MLKGSQMFIMNETIAMNVLGVVDQGLSKGLGKPVPGQMCVEAAVCYALGLPHSDDPGCVADIVRSLKIRLNDFSWSSNAARAKGLRRLAIAQLGTKDTLNEKEFATRVATMTIKKIVPIALRNAASKASGKHAAALNAAADRCENEGSVEATLAAYADANAAYYAAYYAAAAYAAAYAARYAARYAASAAYTAYYTSRTDDNKDSVFNLFAEEVVKILVDLKTPGSEYLYLTE